MVIAKQNPIPTPIGSPAETFDDVWWYAPRMPGELRKGRTLELRMDLIHTSADDLFATLWCIGHSGASETAYIVYFDQNEVALGKYMYPGNGVGMTFFYWDTLATGRKVTLSP